MSYGPRVCSVGQTRTEILQCAEQSHEDNYSNNRRAYYRMMIVHLQFASASYQKMFICLALA